MSISLSSVAVLLGFVALMEALGVPVWAAGFR